MTTQAKHTPGPWKLVTMRDGSRNVAGPNNKFVCEFSHEQGRDRDRAEADGRLIASAPTLLAQRDALVAALEAMLDAQGRRRHPLGAPDEGIATLCVEAASKARAALDLVRKSSP